MKQPTHFAHLKPIAMATLLAGVVGSVHAGITVDAANGTISNQDSGAPFVDSSPTASNIRIVAIDNSATGFGGPAQATGVSAEAYQGNPFTVMYADDNSGNPIKTSSPSNQTASVVVYDGGLASSTSAATFVSINGGGNTLKVAGDGITVNGQALVTQLDLQPYAKLSGAAFTGDVSVATNLSVAGATTTNGIANTGDISNSGNISTATLSTTGLATLNSVSVTNNATVGGTLGVTGATTLGSTLAVAGATTLNGATTINNTLTVTGATNINTTGSAVTSIGSTNAASAFTAQGGNSNLSVANGSASLTVTNSLGNTHGLTVGESSTTLSGGTRSTSLTLNDSGATFSNTATGAPVKVTGIADGRDAYDAVNVRQFAGAVASAAAMTNIPGVDTNKQASLGVGLGNYMGHSALAFGGNYRFADNGVFKASVASGLNGGGSKATLGVGAGWSW